MIGAALTSQVDVCVTDVTVCILAQHLPAPGFLKSEVKLCAKSQTNACVFFFF